VDKFGLYVHWPYCARLCPYCDFNIYKNKPDREATLVNAILLDMEYWRTLSGPRALSSIHFGGGTPSLMKPGSLQHIIDLAQKLWPADPDLEIALEANPKDVSAQRLEDWQAVGIERLSVGIQSFDDRVLKFLGRDHDGAQAKQALKMAVKTMPRVSADLIYGWFGQSPDDWQTDLGAATETGVSHISAYQLTIEDKTAFARAVARGQNRSVDLDTSADLYELGVKILSGAGFEQYEISNFAKNAAARSRHNLLYWHGGNYIGVGPGAHGRLTKNGKRMATIAALKPQDYIDQVSNTGHGITSRETLSAQERAEEYVLMGLRITQGISLDRYQELSGQNLNPELIEDFVQTGLLMSKNGQLTATPSGRLVLDRLSHELLS